MANINPTIWAATGMEALMDNVSLVDLVDRTYEKEIKGFGEAIEVPVIGAISFQSGAGTETVVANATGEGTISIKLDQEEFANVRLKDLDLIQAQIDKVRVYSMAMSKGLKVSKLTANLAAYMAVNAATANKKQFTELVSGATTLTYAVLLEIVQALDVADFPADERYIAVPYTMKKAFFNIVDDEGNKVFINKDYTNVNSFDKGIVSQGLGLNVIFSNNLPKLTATGTISATPGENVKECVIAFHKSAVACVVPLDVRYKSNWDIATRSDVIVGSLYFGRQVMRSNGIIVVRQNT